MCIRDRGEEAYQARISELSSGDTYQRIAGVLISRDPLMILFENTLFRNVTSSGISGGNKNASDVTSEAS